MRAIVGSSAGLLITSAFEISITVVSGSVALLSDALHNLGDVFTTVGVYFGFRASRKQPTQRYPYGYGRAEDLTGIIIVIATDAPLDHRELERLGRRALLGVGRTGSPNDQRFRRLCGRLLHRSRRAPAAQRRAFTAFRSDGGSDRRGDLQLAPARHYGAQRSGHGGGVAARTRSFDPQAIRRGALRQALRISITSATITPASVRVRVRRREPGDSCLPNPTMRSAAAKAAPRCPLIQDDWAHIGSGACRCTARSMPRRRACQTPRVRSES